MDGQSGVFLNYANKLRTVPIPAGAENTSSETNMIEVFSFADKALNCSHFFLF